jgi:hypothetical protein
MSSAYVRDQFRAQLQTMLVAQGFTYFESINEAHRTQELPLKWYTVDFAPSDLQPISLGVPALYRETGGVSVAIFIEQNVTDADATEAADEVRTAFIHWHDDTGNLRVISVQPPQDLDGGDFRGAFYGMSVDVLYQFDRIE